MLSFLFLAFTPNPRSQGHLVPSPLTYFQTNHTKDLVVVGTLPPPFPATLRSITQSF